MLFSIDRLIAAQSKAPSKQSKNNQVLGSVDVFDAPVERVGISDNFKTVFAKVKVIEGFKVDIPEKKADLFFLQVYCKLPNIPRELYPVSGKFMVKSKKGLDLFGYLFLSESCSTENIVILDRKVGITDKNLIRFNNKRKKDPVSRQAKKAKSKRANSKKEVNKKK